MAAPVNGATLNDIYEKLDELVTSGVATDTTDLEAGIGAPADAPTATPSTSGSLISKIGGMWTALLAALNSTDPVPVTVLPAEDAATATIDNAASLSGAVQVDGKFVGVGISAAWTAAGLEFQSSVDNVTFRDVYYAGAKYAVASAGVVASGYVAVDPLVFLGANYIKIRSATSGSAVNQGAERILAVRISG